MIDPDDYWINNPLITPINKVAMYDSDIYDAVIGERERIIALIKKDCQHPKFGERCFHSHLLDEIEAQINRENQKDNKTVSLLTQGENK